jgi:hypothetical protein
VLGIYTERSRSTSITHAKKSFHFSIMFQFLFFSFWACPRNLYPLSIKFIRGVVLFTTIFLLKKQKGFSFQSLTQKRISLYCRFFVPHNDSVSQCHPESFVCAQDKLSSKGHFFLNIINPSLTGNNKCSTLASLLTISLN